MKATPGVFALALLATALRTRPLPGCVAMEFIRPGRSGIEGPG